MRLFLLLVTIAAQVLAQGPQPKFHYDSEFRGDRRCGYFPSASTMWGHMLVDDCNVLDYEIRPVARPQLVDLLARLDRPIAKEIALGAIPVKAMSPQDELAAGIALWTIACKNSAYRLPAERYFVAAESYLAKAAKDCDPVGKSFARLASAYCCLGDAGEGPESAGSPISGERLKRRMRCKAALIRVYEDFYTTVPERSLRAAREVFILCIQQGLSKDADHWGDIIHKQFSRYSGWRSYVS